MDLFHVSSSDNFLADYLSRVSPAQQPAVEDPAPRFLTEAEAEALLKHLTVPEGLTLPATLVQKILNEEGLKEQLPASKPKNHNS